VYKAAIARRPRYPRLLDHLLEQLQSCRRNAVRPQDFLIVAGSRRLTGLRANAERGVDGHFATG
jgi:hypothetical protein